MQETEQETVKETEEQENYSETTEEKQNAGAKVSPKRGVAEYIKRYLVLIAGLVVMSFGVALSIKATLGTSPVSSIPQVTAVMSGLSVGVTTMIVNTIIVLLQIVILRKRFRLIRLMQIPVSIAFGFFIDIAALCIDGITVNTYIMKWVICIAGIVLVGIGVGFEMAADVITLAGEGLAQSLCMVTHIKFGYMKVIVDVSFVVIAVVLSFIFLKRLEGVREGTIAAALFVGLIAKFLNRFLSPLAQKLCAPHSKEEPSVCGNVHNAA